MLLFAQTALRIEVNRVLIRRRVDVDEVERNLRLFAVFGIDAADDDIGCPDVVTDIGQASGIVDARQALIAIHLPQFFQHGDTFDRIVLGIMLALELFERRLGQAIERLLRRAIDGLEEDQVHGLAVIGHDEFLF